MSTTQESVCEVTVCYPTDDASVVTWVEEFTRLLSRRLSRRTATGPEVQVRPLPIGLEIDSLDPESAANLSVADAVLFVLTDTFLASDWISSEPINSNGDFSILLKCAESHGDKSGFLVQLSHLAGDVPPELRQSHVHRFWQFDPESEQTTVLPTSLGDVVFLSALNNLAIEVRKALDERRPKPPSVGERSAQDDGDPAAPRPCIVLASVTDDLNNVQRGVRDYLLQNGCEVPREVYFGEAGGIRERLASVLAGADLFVQLLSEYPGKEVPGSEDVPGTAGASFSQFQYKVAQESGIPLLQWRSAELTHGRIEELELSADHRSLLTGSEVQSRNIEEFKPEILRRVQGTQEECAPEIKGNAEWVFVHSRSDETVAVRELVQHLEDRQFFVTTLKRTGSAREIFDDLEWNVTRCDGMVVIYDDPRSTWVDQQLVHMRKMLFRRPAPKRSGSSDQTFPVRALYLGPPPRPREPIRIRFPGMESIDCTSGLNSNRIEPFLNRITTLAEDRMDSAVMDDDLPFEVFLAHNSMDKDYVRRIHAALKENGVRSWIDAEQIFPGDAPTRVISRALSTIGVVAVFIGPRGEGQWQDDEIDAVLGMAAQVESWCSQRADSGCSTC